MYSSFPRWRSLRQSRSHPSSASPSPAFARSCSAPERTCRNASTNRIAREDFGHERAHPFVRRCPACAPYARQRRATARHGSPDHRTPARPPHREDAGCRAFAPRFMVVTVEARCFRHHGRRLRTPLYANPNDADPNSDCFPGACGRATRNACAPVDDSVTAKPTDTQPHGADDAPPHRLARRIRLVDPTCAFVVSRPPHAPDAPGRAAAIPDAPS